MLRVVSYEKERRLNRFIRCSSFLFCCSNHFKYNHFFLKSKVIKED
nr:MAG TPA: hypothetical protein [Caudoviricetes sp.]